MISQNHAVQGYNLIHCVHIFFFAHSCAHITETYCYYRGLLLYFFVELIIHMLMLTFINLSIIYKLKSCRRHRYLSLLTVVCCQVEVSASDWSTRPEESYRLWCVVVCDLETSRMRRPWPALGHRARGGGCWKGTQIFITFKYFVITGFKTIFSTQFVDIFKSAKQISYSWT